MSPSQEEGFIMQLEFIMLLSTEEYEGLIERIKSEARGDYECLLFMLDYFPGLFEEKKLDETFMEISQKLKNEVTSDGRIDGRKLFGLIRAYPMLLKASRYGCYHFD